MHSHTLDGFAILAAVIVTEHSFHLAAVLLHLRVLEQNSITR